ncbi:MAG: hypothetical protein LBT00_15270 [Spirochaetaceae bacterium]|nr:hypothetical protein [Spirochaetaceae bacterium]
MRAGRSLERARQSRGRCLLWIASGSGKLPPPRNDGLARCPRHRARYPPVIASGPLVRAGAAIQCGGPSPGLLRATANCRALAMTPP